MLIDVILGQDNKHGLVYAALKQSFPNEKLFNKSQSKSVNQKNLILPSYAR